MFHWTVTGRTSSSIHCIFLISNFKQHPKKLKASSARDCKSIIGLSDTETVKLDFDDLPFKTVKYWAERAMTWHKLDGFMILKSSEKCYHVLFNRSVSWSENVRIVAWVSLQAHNQGLDKWFKMQCIKESSTLRISPKREKLSPRIVFRFGKQDQQIADFVKKRLFIKHIIKKM